MKNHVPELMEGRLLVAEKLIFPHPGLDPMFIMNRIAMGLTLKTTSLFEKLHIHMFSFLNNSTAIWHVGNFNQLLIFFFSLRRKILCNLKLCSWKPGVSARVLIVNSSFLLSLMKLHFLCGPLCSLLP